MGEPLRDSFTRVLQDAKQYVDTLTRTGADERETETLDLVLDSVRPWAAQHLDDREIDERAELPEPLLRSAAQLGLFGLPLPTTYGGAGLSFKATGRVVQEIARFDRSMAVTVAVHASLGSQGILQFGSEQLKNEFLPGMASGERLSAFALSEPGAGSDLGSVSTEAILGDDSRLRLSGSKTYVTNGGFADVFTILAKTPGLGGRRRGHSLILLERDTPGFTVGPEFKKLGLNGSSTVAIYFDEAEVDPGRIIGEPSKGRAHAAQILSTGRLMLSAGCLGAAGLAYERAASYVTIRKQFSRPLGSFGQVREKIADMRAELYAMESLFRLTGQLYAEPNPDAGWESALSKIYCTDGLWQIVDEALQLHGGAGFIEEFGLARVLRDARVVRIFDGANELLRFQIASHVLLCSTGQTDSGPTLASAVGPALKREAERFDALRTALDRTSARLAKRLGSAMFVRQVPLRALSEAILALYAMLAVILRTEGELRDGDPAGQLSLARYLTARLARRAQAGLALSEDEDHESIVNEISAEQYRLAAKN